MNEVVGRLRRVEDRLARLLASGWRNAAGEAADLAGEADALAALGLGELTNRLRKVAAAADETEALPSIALSLAALRLLRARLPVDDAPPGSWTPLVAPAKRKASPPDRLVPLGSMALSDGEAWACVRVRGLVAVEWVLVDPPQNDRAAARDFSPPWLRGQLYAHQRWQARYPLGASGEVQRSSVVDATWKIPAGDDDLFAHFREELTGGKLKDGQRVLAGGDLRTMELDPAESDHYVWPDPAASTAFRSAASGRVWALVWTPGNLIAPLAVLVPGGLFRRPRLVHLVPGNPAETVTE